MVRVEPHANVPGLLVLRATLDELDELHTLVEHLEGAARSAGRREVFEGLRASLCTAIDGV